MKLLRIYIENFGCLSKYNKEFSSNINIIEEENGFGKTTLANFIKAMFYGFTNNKKSIDDNDRLKYAPWQGGNFGGFLDFEHEDKKYRIERFFNPVGSTKDTFNLYDLDSNKISKDYTKNIGEEIFKVDVDGFIRSVYIPQTNIPWSDNKKLSQNLSTMLESSSDTVDIADAIKRLEAESKKYVKIGNKGLIAETKTKIASLEEKLETADISKENTSVLITKLNSIVSELEKTTEKLSIVKEQIKEANKQNQKEALFNHYKSLVNNKEQIKRELDILNKFFKDKYPTKEQISHNYELLERLSIIQGDLNKTNTYVEMEFNKLRDYFRNAPEICEEDIRTKIKENEELKKISIEREEISNQIDKIDEKLENETVLTQSHKMIYILFAFFSALLTIPGIIILIDLIAHFSLGKLITGIILVILGIIFGVASVAIFISRANKNHKKLQKYKELEETCNANKAALLSRYNELDHKFSVLNNIIKDFVIKYEKIDNSLLSRIKDDEDYLIELNNISNAFRNYEKLSIEQNRLENKRNSALAEFALIKSELDGFTKYYYENLEPFQALKQIQLNFERYEELYVRYTKAEKELETFLKENQVEENHTVNLYNIQELEKEEISLDKKLSSLLSEKLIIENHIKNNEMVIDNAFEIEQQVALEKEQLNEYIYNYEIIEKTIKYLSDAKEKQSSNYLDKMQESFLKYLSKLLKQDINFSLSTDLEISSLELGSKKELGFYSTGYQDLIIFCARMALVETMLDDTSPFLVLDDPFTNLDNKKLVEAINLLKEISNEYQIIYMVCHSSRTVK